MRPLVFRYRQTLKRYKRPLIMGVLNATPDSFFSGSRVQQLDQALNSAEEMLKAGADILDIGGQSTRPGAEIISVDEERERVLPVVDAVAARFPEAMISVDTFYAAIAADANMAGAGIVNDISAGGLDKDMFNMVAGLEMPYVLMHMQGTPKTMQLNPQYDDAVNETIYTLSAKLDTLRQLGVADVWVDPGFGFGKTLGQNYQLLNRLREFQVLDCPVLAGVSRKGMIWKLLGCSPKEALNGTSVVNTIALLNGASILRVHDVKEALEAAEIVSFAQSL